MRPDNSEILGPGLLCSADVEAYFGRSDRTVRRWVKKGHLTPIYIGGALFFHPDEIKQRRRAHLERAVDTAERLTDEPDSSAGPK